ncbi:IclR family transcriptional regulator [Rhodococcus sp. OK302]|uniref:IclR family transcriptional regulator n=1 Tax=Rhodococcus sp. OK302 TaxID=1882769 RepID=UPI000B94260A|nr:IclR family transcriptional regulator C-terminal domain-containing protein [Rhodococcus sp. OK302]OYD70763.1 IclR family transcriptional regulator [Rhodococcus sp. OK302]
MSSVKEIQSVRNACRVFEAISQMQPVGVSDLARTIDIDKSAVHRLAVTLHSAGWLERTEDGRWTVSPTILATIRASATTTLATDVRHLVEAARDQSGETAMLVVPEGNRLMIVDAAESRQTLRVSVTVGTEMLARTSSALRAIAAHLPADELGPWRMVDSDLTDASLAKIRRRGWAQNDGEGYDGTRAVGAALLRGDDVPVAALVICAPSTRFQPERAQEHGALVARLAESWTGR